MTDEAPPPSSRRRRPAGVPGGPPSSRRGAPPPSRRVAPKPTLFGRLVLLAVALYAVGLVGVLGMMLVAVDRFWLATLIAFGPRWVFALPLPVLFLAILLARRWLLLPPLAACAFVVVVPILDHSFGLGTDDRGQPLRVVTQNLGAMMKLDDPRFLGLLKETKADVVLVQECWRDDQPTVSPDPAYHFVVDYTMCILSRFPVTKVAARPRQDVWDRGGSGDICVFELETPNGPVWILSVQLETAREGFEAFLVDKLGGVPKIYENIELRRWESGIAIDWAKANTKAPLVIAGDFNMPVESSIYKQYWSHYQNAWSRCGVGFGWTKRTRKIGARIDHVLYDESWGCADASFAPDIGSDHRGLVADLRLLPSGG